MSSQRAHYRRCGIEIGISRALYTLANQHPFIRVKHQRAIPSTMTSSTAPTVIQSITLRNRVFRLLGTGDSRLLGKIIDWFLMALIAVNVFAVILETEATVEAEYRQMLFWLEIFSVAVFSVEYLLRLWSCLEDPQYAKLTDASARMRYMFTPMAIIDLLAIAPFYLAFLFNIDLRFLRVLRLLRIFKLTRYSEAMTTLLKVLKDEMSSFAAAIFIMLVIMIIAASGIYLMEHDVQPDAYGSIPQSMWWSIVTLTTVGYGDVYPITTVGKIFAAIIMVAGVGLVALPTGILASSFSDNLHQNRNKMTRKLNEALSDGFIDEDEAQGLEELRKQLGLTEEQMSELHDTLLELKHDSPESQNIHSCPLCGK